MRRYLFALIGLFLYFLAGAALAWPIVYLGDGTLDHFVLLAHLAPVVTFISIASFIQMIKQRRVSAGQIGMVVGLWWSLPVWLNGCAHLGLRLHLSRFAVWCYGVRFVSMLVIPCAALSLMLITVLAIGFLRRKRLLT